MAGLAAVHYANALFSLALEENCLDEIKENLLSIDALVESNSELMTILKHPKVHRDDKKEILTKVFSDIHPYTKNFIRLLVDKNRFMFFSQIVKCYINAYNQHFNIEIAYVESAVKLNDEQLEKIKVMLERKMQKHVDMHISVNPDLLAGIRVKIGNEVLDNSAASRLQSMKNRVMKTTLEKSEV